MMKTLIVFLSIALITSKLSFQMQRIENQSVFLSGTTSSAPSKTLIDFINNRDGLYTIPLKIGSSNKIFNILPDTGSNILWISSVECKKCTQPNKFNPINSKTFIRTGEKSSIGYVTGKVNGIKVKDEIDVNGLKLNDFKFLLVESGEIPAEFDGIIGLSRYHNDKEESLIEHLMEHKIIEKRIFAQIKDGNKLIFEIGDLPDKVLKKQGHYLEMGDLQQVVNTYGNTTKNYSHWAVPLEYMLFGDVAFDMKGTPSIFDTGSNVFLAPKHFIKIFLEKFFKGQECEAIDDESQISCTNMNVKDLPKLEFVFKGKQFLVPTESLFFDNGNEKTLRIVFTTEFGNIWLIGQSLLENYTIVFNKENETVGIHSDNEFIQNSVTNAIFPSMLGNVEIITRTKFDWISLVIGFSFGIMTVLFFTFSRNYLVLLTNKTLGKVNEKLIL